MLVLALLLACRAPAPATPPTPVSAAPTCIVTWDRAADASVLAEQRGSGAPAWSDFAEGYAAADPVGHVAVKHTERFRVGGEPVLWFTPDYAAVVVDQDSFSSLVIADATALSAGQSVAVGIVTDAARQELGDRGVAELLIEADVVRIYAHIGGRACLQSESTEAGAYTATFGGEHVYFTNAENRDALAFVVRIGADGAITVSGA